MTGVQRFPDWDTLGASVPDIAAPMRRYLQQLTAILRPGSVSNADQALRSLAAFLTEQAPEVRFVADIRRHHVEDYRTWLAARPGQRTARLTPAGLAHRLGTLRMFFVRICDWDRPEAPVRVPIIPGDLPRQDHPLPKALDDPAAAKLLRAAQADPRMLTRVVVEVLLRTGLRVGEFTALQADAVMLIGAAHWLHVPVGKLHDDRYLPLHPHLVTLIDDYRTSYVAADNPLLLPRESGTALDRHTATRLINKAGAAAGLSHIHPHQLRHTLATQAINRGMTLEAIAALLGHRSLDMTLRYAKIANRTVADEYFAVTEKVESLYQQGQPLPTDTIGPRMARLRREHHRLLGNGYCTRPPRAGLRLRGHLRNLHLLPDQHRVPAHPAAPTRPRHPTRPTPPRRPVQHDPDPHRRPSILTQHNPRPKVESLMTGVNLAPDPAVELTELLEFLNAWLTSDRHHLDASLHRDVGHPAYNIDRLKTDPARFTFLLGGDTDGELFQPPTTT